MICKSGKNILNQRIFCNLSFLNKCNKNNKISVKTTPVAFFLLPSKVVCSSRPLRITFLRNFLKGENRTHLALGVIAIQDSLRSGVGAGRGLGSLLQWHPYPSSPPTRTEARRAKRWRLERGPCLLSFSLGSPQAAWLGKSDRMEKQNCGLQGHMVGGNPHRTVFPALGGAGAGPRGGMWRDPM